MLKDWGSLRKTFLSRRARKYKADIIMIQETKKFSVHKQCFRTFWGGRNKDWIHIPSQGSAGGVLIAWRTYLFELTAVEHGFFSLSARITDRNSGFSWLLSCIYGSSMNIGKQEFWIELNDIGNLIKGAWCVRGDFDEILYSWERNVQNHLHCKCKNSMNGFLSLE